MNILPSSPIPSTNFKSTQLEDKTNKNDKKDTAEQRSDDKTRSEDKTNMKI